MYAPSPLLTPDTARSLTRVRTLGEPDPSPHARLQWLGWDAASRHLLSVQGRGDAQLRWWDLASDGSGPLFTRPLAGGVAAWFLPDARTLLSVTIRGALQTWSVADGELLSTVETGMSVSGACLSAEGTQLLLSAPGGRVLLWDLRRSWLVWRREEPAYLYGCALSPDGHFAAAGAAEEQEGNTVRASLRLWDARTGRLLGTHAFEHSNRTWTVAFAPSGEALVAGTSSGQVVFLGLPDLCVLRSLEGPGAGALHVEFNRDGSLLAISADTCAFEVRAVHDGRRLFSDSDLDDMESSTVAFSPDGRFVSWGMDDGKVGIWGAARGALGPGGQRD
ncbi:WD40 repeat domain-containing protein [Corallococcus sp. BB11-1]|uniref:WD40 repeat domain-containing protein n=1 Tax=Corallococcus sp. BB11-1 TaxID=2996783 RepID=UPI00226DA9B4|nr:WD40 repeat domain-containing protein [Corallococcus sp. BB11-1]MCY1032385.1 WD40 repeat domain-containing protein [Corallococcus sp. BB11-1]